jgi:hypothetical protein
MYVWIATGIVLVTLVVLVAPIGFLNAGQYQALTAGVQALGVTAALVFGAATLYSDSHSRKVDRVLDFHSALTTGDIQAARIRLLNRLREDKDTIVPVSFKQLRNDRTFSVYKNSTEDSPLLDVNRVLRFIERANAARIAGIVDLPLFHELIGEHIIFWDHAITHDDTESLARSLRELASWVNRYTRTTAINAGYLARWDANMRRNFGWQDSL